MSSKNSIQIGLDFILNNAQSSIKQVQSLLDGLNISKLDAQFGKNFSASMVKQLNTLSTESEKLKTSLQQSLDGKVDEKGIARISEYDYVRLKRIVYNITSNNNLVSSLFKVKYNILYFDKLKPCEVYLYNSLFNFISNIHANQSQEVSG